MTSQHLCDLEKCYQHVHKQAERARQERNAGIREAVEDGWTHAEIARATGLTRGRVGQLAMR